MINSIYFYGTAFVLFLIGLFGVMTRKNILKIVVSLTITETAVNIFLVSVGYIEGGKAPILTKTIGSVSANSLKFVDPLPQALVLTAIVIGLGTTALALGVVINLYRHYGTLDITKMGKDR